MGAVQRQHQFQNGLTALPAAPEPDGRSFGCKAPGPGSAHPTARWRLSPPYLGHEQLYHSGTQGKIRYPLTLLFQLFAPPWKTRFLFAKQLACARGTIFRG